MTEALEERVSRIELEMDRLRDIVSAEQLAIEQLRTVVAEHSKQLEKIAITIDRETETVNRLVASMEGFKVQLKALMGRLDDIAEDNSENIKMFREMLDYLYKTYNSTQKAEVNKWRITLSVLKDLAVAGFVVIAGLKAMGVI